MSRIKFLHSLALMAAEAAPKIAVPQKCSTRDIESFAKENFILIYHHSTNNCAVRLQALHGPKTKQT